MTATTWTTAQVPAYRLAVGDRIALGSTTVALATVMEEDRSMILGPIQADIDCWEVQVYYRDPITVHVPDEPVDGYNLWRPKPGTFSYSQCTCVHRRDTDGSWRPICNDCPACVHRANDDWSD